MNYRIYWPDIKDYSAHESLYPERLIQHGINCGCPFEIRRGDEVVASWTPEEGIVWSEAYQPVEVTK